MGNSLVFAGHDTRNRTAPHCGLGLQLSVVPVSVEDARGSDDLGLLVNRVDDPVFARCDPTGLVAVNSSDWSWPSHC